MAKAYMSDATEPLPATSEYAIASTPLRRVSLTPWRLLAMTVAVLCGETYAVAAGAVPTCSASNPAGADCSLGPRVRSSHAYLRAMIDEAGLRSPVFRSLVAAVEATDGIVYVEHGACTHGVRACLALEVTAAGEYRILRVFVDARQPDWDVMASIGHELRHAIEVLENPALVDDASIYLLYAQNREGKDRPFETRAAIEAGDAVRHDVSSFAKGRPK